MREELDHGLAAVAQLEFAVIGAGFPIALHTEPSDLDGFIDVVNRFVVVRDVDTGVLADTGVLSDAGAPSGLERAERAYGAAWQAAKSGSAAAVEFSYEALVSSYAAWRGSGDSHGLAAPRARQLYDSSLSLLLREAQRHGRWDPRMGILLHLPDGSRVLPVRYRGFAWTSADFQQLELIGEYPTTGLHQVQRREGLGVPLVVIRTREQEERFFEKVMPFSATALWKPGPAAPNDNRLTPAGDVMSLDDAMPLGDAMPTGDVMPTGGVGVLELLDPDTVTNVSIGAATYPLGADFSARFAWAILREPSRARIGFFQPGASTDKPKLFMVSPHRPGKIPVVFVHGLLSDPTTWVAAANTLMADPWFRERYEVWGFRYPTGDAFLRSAATLRQELRVLYKHLQGLKPDPALSRMVVVGHSLGGLVTKLQVCSSGGETLWRSAANQSLDSIRATPRTREELRKLFVFEPQPFVKRVVFIATPHGGSGWSTQLIGRFASSLVEPPRQRVVSHCRLTTDNPGVFAPYIRRRIPTSIDLLEPSNPLLMAIRRLPIAPTVQVHSVIGTGRRPHRLGKPSDCVVPVESAQLPGAIDELFVPERHEDVQRHPRTLQFLQDVLRSHVAEPSVTGPTVTETLAPTLPLAPETEIPFEELPLAIPAI